MYIDFLLLCWIGNKVQFMKRCSFERKLITIMSFHKTFLSLINFTCILIITSVLAIYNKITLNFYHSGIYLSQSLICDLFRANIFKSKEFLCHITILVVTFVTEL